MYYEYLGIQKMLVGAMMVYGFFEHLRYETLLG